MSFVASLALAFAFGRAAASTTAVFASDVGVRSLLAFLNSNDQILAVKVVLMPRHIHILVVDALEV